MTLPDGRDTHAVLLPVTLAANAPACACNPPQLGEHTVDVLAELGYNAEQIAALTTQNA
jgi:crotonobetainyl-CoA:carnitine CoA-transferase CaiB-like acyl-CoA transferase